MEQKNETGFVSRAEYNELLEKLKASEILKNKISRELRSTVKRNEIYKLNFETQSGLNKTITNEKLRQELYVRLLLESCPDIIFIFDESTKFLLCTKSITNIINIEDPTLLHGRTLDSIIERYHPPAFTEQMVSLINSTIENHYDSHIEKKFEVTTKNYKYEVNLLSFHKDTGEFAGVLVVMHDITELIKAREISEQASRAKGEFLSRMSHEMRTPMNAIIGMTNIAKKSKDHAKKEYCLDKIDGASKHLLGVINDILDMSKIEANKFELSNYEFDFEKMLMNVTNIVNFNIEEKQQTLIINLDKNIPSSIVGDEVRLMQVITNLLTNAAKFTPEGGAITLNAKRLPDSNGESSLQIEVIDNGIGISAEQQSRLFSSFEQAEGGTARKYGGTGLGLAISKRIITLMGGKIWIESELGKGAKFIFTMKFEKGTDKAALEKLSVNRKDMRILAVDDAPEVREYFQQVFWDFGMSCDVASDGYEALYMVNNAKDKPYDIFFIDWQMPRMNGVDLSKKIKEIVSENAIIIMISVSDWSDIESEATQAGIDNFISKPLFPSILVNTINRYMGADSSHGNVMQDQTWQNTHNYQNHTLLIAEDIEINREIMAAVLEDTGALVEFAENGVEAVSKFCENPGKYSLLLMDIHMPVMDGYEATRKIRSLVFDKAKTVPIVAMTANVFREDIDRCLAAGMNDHLGKPVDTDELFYMLDKYLPLRLSPPKEEEPEPAMPEPAETTFSYEDLLPVIDVKNALHRLMNNKKLYLKLLGNFSGRSMADELIQNIKDTDFSKTRQAAHALKGVAANLGLTELMQVASDIESLAKTEVDAVEAIPRLDTAVDAACASIKKLLEHETE